MFVFQFFNQTNIVYVYVSCLWLYPKFEIIASSQPTTKYIVTGLDFGSGCRRVLGYYRWISMQRFQQHGEGRWLPRAICDFVCDFHISVLCDQACSSDSWVYTAFPLSDFRADFGYIHGLPHTSERCRLRCASAAQQSMGCNSEQQVDASTWTLWTTRVVEQMCSGCKPLAVGRRWRDQFFFPTSNLAFFCFY